MTDEKLLFVCHLMANGEASYSTVLATDALMYPRVIPKDVAHKSECVEALGATEEESLEKAKRFHSLRLSPVHADLKTYQSKP